MANSYMYTSSIFNQNYHFLVLEDITETAEVVINILKQNFPGCDVQCFGSGLEGMDYLEKAEKLPDFLYCDRMLDDVVADQLIGSIRSQPRYNNMPIMIVTANGNDSNEALNLSLGADDYIRKPISPERFIARIKTLLRNFDRNKRTPALEGKDMLVYGDFVIDAPKVRASYKGATCDLTTTEFKLLHFLASNERNVFSRDTLLEKVWGYEYSGDNRTVDVTVARTRKKIKEVAQDVDAESCIITRRGAGYAFDPNVFKR